MRVTYNKNRKLVGLSLLPLSRSGPELWFNNYEIVSLQDWDAVDSGVKVHAVNEDSKEQPYLKMQSLIENPNCLELLGDKFKDYDILIARSVSVPKELNGRKLLMLGTDLSQKFENKANLRTFFNRDLPFPGYKIYKTEDLDVSQKDFEAVIGERRSVIIQDENSSSSKGTYLIDDYVSFRKLVLSLRVKEVRRIIVSDYIEEADELSVQGCITKDGVILGPLQRQIINSVVLCNPSLQATEKFCGGIIDAHDQELPVSKQAKTIAEKAAKKLKEEGYRGLFGIDFLLGKDQKLYVTEINARPTGLTPLLTSLDLPLLLLHILELGGYDYEIEDKELDLKDGAGLFILHSKEDAKLELKSIPRSGTYALRNGVLQKTSSSIVLAKLKPREFILQTYYTEGTAILPGGRLVRLMFKGKTMDKNEKVLYNEVEQTIRIVEDNITLN